MGLLRIIETSNIFIFTSVHFKSHMLICTNNTQNIQRCRLIDSVQVIVDDLYIYDFIDDHRNLKFKSIIIKKKKKILNKRSLFISTVLFSLKLLSLSLCLLDRPKIRNLISRSSFLTTSKIFSGKSKRKQTETHIFSPENQTTEEVLDKTTVLFRFVL